MKAVCSSCKILNLLLRFSQTRTQKRFTIGAPTNIILSGMTMHSPVDKDMLWEISVDTRYLSPFEKLIHKRHKAAVEVGLDLYTDPQTGYSVMTRLAHLRRGECCGNACRHCPYGQINVPEHRKKKFNTAFYV